MLSFKPTGRRARRTVAISLTAAAALALSACGGGDSSSSTTSSTTPTTSSSPSTAGSTTASTTGTDATAVRQLFEQQLKKQLGQQGQVTSAQANCVIKKLESSLSDQDILNSQQNPGAIQQAATNAAVSCGVGQ
jgi:ABC-type oligopeptide transport system substrate-binding subunit